MRTTAIRGTAVAVLLSAAALGLAGCVNAEQSAPAGAGQSQSFGPAPTTSAAPKTTASSGGTNPSGANGSHSSADIAFLDTAVQLRDQAVSLATAASTASTDTRVKTLAGQIANTGPSVTTMSNTLAGWGAPAPTTVPGQIQGLLTETQVQQIESASGTPFNMQWLQGMKGNLTAAQQAATSEASKGSDPATKQLAQQWVGQLKTQLNSLAAISG